MYLIEVNSTESDYPMVALNGRIEDSNYLRKELMQILNSFGNAEKIIIDLGGLEAINDECLIVFTELSKEWQINFVRYSLFLEDKLRTFGLIDYSLQ